MVNQLVNDHDYDEHDNDVQHTLCVECVRACGSNETVLTPWRLSVTVLNVVRIGLGAFVQMYPLLWVWTERRSLTL